MFGFTISTGAKLSTLPFGSDNVRKVFMDAVITKVSLAGKEGGSLHSPYQAKHWCEMSEPDVLLHLVAPIGQGHHRDVAVTATIQIMHVSGKGVAAIVMGFEQVDPQLWSLRVGPNAELEHDQQTLPSMSSVSYEDEVNMCACPECRSDATSICSNMRWKLMSSNMSESDRSSTVVTGQDEREIPLLVNKAQRYNHATNTCIATSILTRN